MERVMQGDWIADLGALVCRNVKNGIIVNFEMTGRSIAGKIKDMPMELVEKWAEMPKGYELVIKAVEEAEEVFLRAAVEREFSKNNYQRTMSKEKEQRAKDKRVLGNGIRQKADRNEKR